jgi:hypothetical protein
VPHSQTSTHPTRASLSPVCLDGFGNFLLDFRRQFLVRQPAVDFTE